MSPVGAKRTSAKLCWDSLLAQGTKSLRDSPLRGEPNRECGNRGQDRQSINSLHGPLRRCGLSASMVVADRTVRNSARDAEGYICLVKNLNDGHRAEAVIILTSSLRQFRLDKIEVCCGLQKLVRPMMFQGCCKADRAEVVERDRFATPNSLKSHGERNLLSPFSNTCAITPKLCMSSRPVHPSKNYPALKSRTAAKSP